MAAPTEPSTVHRPESPLLHWVRRPVFWAVCIMIAFAIPIARSMVRRPTPALLPILGTVPDFKLMDETGVPFARHQLDERVWVANFIFTRCPTVCPLLSAKMEQLQKRTRHLGRTFHLVSFSVDPERDTPAALQAYARRYNADQRGWTFLTGRLGDMEQAVVRGFKISMARVPQPDSGAANEGTEANTKDEIFDIVHGQHLVLVDGAAQIRGYYDTTEEGLDRLIADIERLVAFGQP